MKKKVTKKASKRKVKAVKKVTKKTVKKEREPQECQVKRVYHTVFIQDGRATGLMLDIYQAEDGDYKGEYVGVVSQQIELTKSCKTIEEVKEIAFGIVRAQTVIDGNAIVIQGEMS